MAQQAIDQAVQVTAAAQTNPPAIILAWPENTNAISYTIYRKPRDGTFWGPPLMTLGSYGTNYMDTNVVIGTGYELGQQERYGLRRRRLRLFRNSDAAG